MPCGEEVIEDRFEAPPLLLAAQAALADDDEPWMQVRTGCQGQEIPRVGRGDGRIRAHRVAPDREIGASAEADMRHMLGENASLRRIIDQLGGQVLVDEQPHSGSLMNSIGLLARAGAGSESTNSRANATSLALIAG